MTRESIPRFDLYAELEVSRLASVEVIEAAFRTLAKLHHPDVSAAGGDERIKRLNLAHDWLTDPLRRRRYDNATRADAAPASARSAPREAPEPTERSGRRSSAKAFGVNTAEVREFLADLRSLDEQQAAEVHAGKAATDAMAYAVAQHVATTIGRSQRQSEWLLAREAAAVIVRGKLRDSQLQTEVAAVLADIAGAIAVRDLIARTDYEVLLQPWGWRDENGALASPAPASAGAATGIAAARAIGGNGAGGGMARSTGAAARGIRSAPGTAGHRPLAPTLTAGRLSRSVLSSPRAVLAMIGVVALVGTAVALTGPRPEAVVAGMTDAPSGAVPPTLVAVASSAASAPVTPGFSPDASTAPTEGASATPGRSFAPGSTPRLTPRPTPTAAPSLPPTASPTSAPTAAPSPVPTPAPTSTPAPTTAPTLLPTPSPVACTVPPFIGQSTGAAPGLWTGAFFTGTITYSPTVPPQYKVGWQSLTAGASVPCASDITLMLTAPTPAP